jgi:hypothetical protein
MWSKMSIGLHVKGRLLLSDFNETYIFMTNLKKKRTSNSMKILLMEAESFHAERRTDGRTDGQT